MFSGPMGIVQQIMNVGPIGKPTKTITSEQFKEFDHEYLFQALQGDRYGLAFCKRFEIVDYLLMLERGINAKDYIEAIYIKDPQ